MKFELLEAHGNLELHCLQSVEWHRNYLESRMRQYQSLSAISPADTPRHHIHFQVWLPCFTAQYLFDSYLLIEHHHFKLDALLCKDVYRVSLYLRLGGVRQL